MLVCKDEDKYFLRDTYLGPLQSLRQNFKIIWQFLEGSLCIWQNIKHT